MIITCASCLTKFNLDDSRISPKGIKVRCSRCKHVFYVVAPPETKEEVMEDFQSFAKYHEDLMVPGEEPRKGPTREAEEKELPPPEKVLEGMPAKPRPPETFGGEKEEESFLFEKRAPEDGGKSEREVLPEREETVEIQPSRRKEASRKRGRRGPAAFLALLVILLLLICGLFYFWTEMKSGGKFSSYLENPIRKIAGIWNDLWGTEKEGLEIGDFTRYEEKIGDLSLLVIEGKVSNQSHFAKKRIKVKVVIFDEDKVKMAEKEAICGRTLSREELKRQPSSFFRGDMVITPQGEMEMVVPSGKVAPFMVIFRDPMNQAKDFKVEIVEAPNQ
jgi:predicted Zn finger-like uncharacterized protein